MPYNRAELEHFMLKAAEMAQASKSFVARISLDELAKLLSITYDDARLMADYLVDLGWMRNVSTSVVITPLGYEQIEKLRWPRWRLWLERHTALVTAIAAVAAILSCVIALLK